jgi:pimeloyl-ACP methyl ester carboxylesterase
VGREPIRSAAHDESRFRCTRPIVRFQFIPRSQRANCRALLYWLSSLRQESRCWRLHTSERHLAARVRKDSAEAAAKIKAGDTSRDWTRRKRQLDLLIEEPHISRVDLQKIGAPTLIIGADSDVMPISHFVEIYNNIRQAHLFIMPGATHGMHRMEHDDGVASLRRILSEDDRERQRREHEPTHPTNPTNHTTPTNPGEVSRRRAGDERPSPRVLPAVRASDQRRS